MNRIYLQLIVAVSLVALVVGNGACNREKELDAHLELYAEELALSPEELAQFNISQPSEENDNSVVAVEESDVSQSSNDDDAFKFLDNDNSGNSVAESDVPQSSEDSDAADETGSKFDDNDVKESYVSQSYNTIDDEYFLDDEYVPAYTVDDPYERTEELPWRRGANNNRSNYATGYGGATGYVGRSPEELLQEAQSRAYEAMELQNRILEDNINHNLAPYDISIELPLPY